MTLDEIVRGLNQMPKSLRGRRVETWELVVQADGKVGLNAFLVSSRDLIDEIMDELDHDTLYSRPMTEDQLMAAFSGEPVEMKCEHEFGSDPPLRLIKRED